MLNKRICLCVVPVYLPCMLLCKNVVQIFPLWRPSHCTNKQNWRVWSCLVSTAPAKTCLVSKVSGPSTRAAAKQIHVACAGLYHVRKNTDAIMHIARASEWHVESADINVVGRTTNVLIKIQEHTFNVIPVKRIELEVSTISVAREQDWDDQKKS